MKPKLMVTGGHGFVAGSVLAQAWQEWEVHAVSRRAGPPGDERAVWHVCEPLRAGEIARIFQAVQPEAVVHTAALADIDFCQAHPDLAGAVNAELTREVVKACALTGARLVHCSTDTVFDGEHAPYTEDAAPGAVNVYAETKIAAELLARKLEGQAVIARLSLVLGLPLFGVGNSSLVRLLGAFKEGRSVPMSEQEVRTPVDVVTAGRGLLELAAGRHTGIFHLAGSTRVNRVQLGRTIALRFGFSAELVTVQPRQATAGRAVRPRDVSLSALRMRKELNTPIRTLDEGLGLILASQGNF